MFEPSFGVIQMPGLVGMYRPHWRAPNVDGLWFASETFRSRGIGTDRAARAALTWWRTTWAVAWPRSATAGATDGRALLMPAAVRIELGVPGQIMPPASAAVTFAQRAEADGFDAVWWPDHLMGWHPDTMWTPDLTPLAASAGQPAHLLRPADHDGGGRGPDRRGSGSASW